MKYENYKVVHFEDCLKLFDKNCPQFFTANEREEYADYLRSTSDLYHVGYIEGKLLSAFGMSINGASSRARVTWIMVCPYSKGQGIGRQMMTYAITLAEGEKVGVIDIAASHLSEPFFAKFGATTIKTIEDGWGVNMHRVDMELWLT